MNELLTHLPIKAIIGLGNPGEKYALTRHNIGFRVVDALAQAYGQEFKKNDSMLICTIVHNDMPILLIKPQTFMNDSGKVIPFLQKKGITANQILVIHDELELPFGQIKIKTGGSAKGHNGLKSMINFLGLDFHRVRIGIGRPMQREQVPDYVLERFKEPHMAVNDVVERSVAMIRDIIAT
jgi:PTH1 family peptidyl-tRNA hydrolase